MIITSSKTLTEAYWDMVNKSKSSGLMPDSNSVSVEVNLSTKDFTAGTPCIRPTVNLSEAIYYHELGLMGKLTYKLTFWLRKQAD